jgi:hypothetical protein
VGVGSWVGKIVVCDEILEVLSLVVVMFVLSGVCCTLPVFRIGGVEKAVLLFVERGNKLMLMIATVTMIATSFHLLVKGIQILLPSLINY